jgi:hypothetical protein
MSYLNDNGNPRTDAKIPAQRDVAAQTKQHALAEIDNLLELIHQLDHASEASEDTSYGANAVLAMQAADRLQQLMGIPSAARREVQDDLER